MSQWTEVRTLEAEISELKSKFEKLDINANKWLDEISDLEARLKEKEAELKKEHTEHIEDLTKSDELDSDQHRELQAKEQENAHLRKVNGITLKKNTIKQSLVIANERVKQLESESAVMRESLGNMIGYTMHDGNQEPYHTLKQKAIDTHNNPTTASKEFLEKYERMEEVLEAIDELMNDESKMGGSIPRGSLMPIGLMAHCVLHNIKIKGE